MESGLLDSNPGASKKRLGKPTDRVGRRTHRPIGKAIAADRHHGRRREVDRAAEDKAAEQHRSRSSSGLAASRSARFKGVQELKKLVALLDRGLADTSSIRRRLVVKPSRWRS